MISLVKKMTCPNVSYISCGRSSLGANFSFPSAEPVPATYIDEKGMFLT
jgi:hypothetical protein